MLPSGSNGSSGRCSSATSWLLQPQIDSHLFDKNWCALNKDRCLVLQILGLIIKKILVSRKDWLFTTEKITSTVSFVSIHYRSYNLRCQSIVWTRFRNISTRRSLLYVRLGNLSKSLWLSQCLCRSNPTTLSRDRWLKATRSTQKYHSESIATMF